MILNVGTPPDPAPPVIGRPAAAEFRGGHRHAVAAAVGAPCWARVDAQRLEHMLDADVEGSLVAKISQSLDDVNAMTSELRLQLNPREQMTLMSKVQRILENLNATTAALRTQASVEDETTMLAKVHDVLDKLESGLGEVNAMLTENRPVIHSTLTRVDSMTQQIDEDVLASVRREFNREDPASLIGKIHAGMDTLNVALEDIQTITDTGRTLVVLNRPALQRTIDNLKDVSDQLKIGVQEIVLAPWRLFKPPAGEIKKLDVFEAARRFAEAATMLDDAAAKLEAIQAATPPTAPATGSAGEIRAIQESLRAAFERFESAEQYLWDQMK